MLSRLFDNYSSIKPNDFSYTFFSAFIDHSCKYCVKLYDVRGYPQCCCYWDKFVCLGSKCRTYIKVKVKPLVIQLSLFDEL